jgi:hypothetical protein
MEYPDETIAVGAKGKREARILRSMGKDFIVYGYFDVDAGKALSKYSILLRNEKGEIEHLIVVPAGGRELVVKHVTEKSPERRGVYDVKSRKIVYF